MTTTTVATDRVAEARDFLLDLLGTCPHLADTREGAVALTVYSADELRDLRDKLDLPCIGLVYGGLRGKKDGTGTGAATLVDFYVYLIGADACHLNINGADVDATRVLGILRSHILDRCAATPGAHRRFFLAEEVPSKIGHAVSYRQKWTTTVVVQRT